MRKITLFLTILIVSLFAFAQPGATDGIDFDGTKSIHLNDSKYINKHAITNRTIEGWFKVDNATNRQMVVKEGGATRGINIYVENNYLIVGAFNNADYSPKWLGTYYRKTISNNTWYHFAIVFSGLYDANSSNYNANNNTNFKFYLDGVLQIEKSGYKINNHGGDVLLGASNSNTRIVDLASSNWNSSLNAEYLFNETSSNNAGNYFTGKMYGIRVWNSAKTVTEINDNMNKFIYSVGENDLVGALLENGFLYLDNNDLTSIAYQDTPINYIWSNGVNSNWSDSSNWDAQGVPPNNFDKIDIKSSATNYPTITTNTFVGELKLESNTTITIPSGVTLTVAYKFANAGKIIVEDGGSFIYRPNLDVSGNFEIKRNSPVLNRYFYSYWSTPVIEADSSPSTTFADYPVIYKFNSNQNPTSWVLNNGDDFIPGHGYAVRQDNATPQSQQITFNGTANNGNIKVELFYNPSDIDPTDFGNNLLGNPYPSALDWKLFNQDSNNTDILNGTAYIWRQSVNMSQNLASDYVTCTNSGCNISGYNGEIASGQGFFVTRKNPATNPGVPPTNNSVTFKNSHRMEGSNNQFFRPSNINNFTNQSWFKMRKNNLIESIYISFQEDATYGYDDLYDGIYNNSNTTLGFYSLIGEEKMAVQTLPNLTENISVPLGYKYDSAGLITLEIDQELINPNFDIILENTYTNEFTNLRETNYSFNVADNVETEINDQFILHYRNNALNTNDDLVKEVNINVYTKNDYLVVKSTKTVKSINVFDINGKLILNSSNKENYIGNINNGVYFVQIILDNNEIIHKKIIF